MSSKRSQPENSSTGDDSDTYRVSSDANDPSNKQGRSVPKRRKKRKSRQSSSEAPFQNPFDAEFDRKAREATRDSQAKASDSEEQSSEKEYLAKRTRIVDTTKKPGESLGASFLYPFYRDGIRLILAYGFFIFIAQLTALLPFVGLTIQPIALMLVGIFVGLTLLETANDTISHQGGGIQWPEIGLDSLGAGLAALGALLVAMAPLWVAFWILGKLPEGDEPISTNSMLFIIGGAISLGLLYLPMSFIALAELENEKAFNPFLVFSRIFQMFGSYLAIVGTILVLFLGLKFLLLKFEPLDSPDSTKGRFIGLISGFIQMLAFVYLSTVLIRAVGLSFRKHGLSFEAKYEEE